MFYPFSSFCCLSVQGARAARRAASKISPQALPALAILLSGWMLGASAQIGEAQTTTQTAASRGLRATYFGGARLSGTPLAQAVVSSVDFNWGEGRPHPAVPIDGWSVRYEGTLEAPYTGEVLVETLSDDGVRLWVGGQKWIDNWTDNGTTSDDARIPMVKGEKLSIVAEFYENSGLALAKMRWSYPGRTAVIIPASAFSSGEGGAVNPTPTPAPAPDSGVIYVAPTGRLDGNGALSNPVRTVSRAIQLAPEGSQIVLRGGTYELTSPVYVNKAGLTIKNFDGEKPLLVASSAPNSLAPHVLVITKSKVTVSGLSIRGGSYYGVKIDPDDAGTPARGVVIRNCRISATGRDCIKTYNADELLIEKCDIGPSGLRDASNAEGIDSIGSRGVIIRNCYVHDTATTGIYLKGGAADGLIENCRVQNTRAHGILLGQDTDLEFMRDGTEFEARRCVARNNQISNTLASGIGTYSGESILFENNLLRQVAQISNAGLMVSVNRRGVGSRNVLFNGNTVEMSSSRPFVFLLDMAGSFSAGNNHYRYVGSPSTFRIQHAGLLQDSAFELWRARTGTDAGSTIAPVSGGV